MSFSLFAGNLVSVPCNSFGDVNARAPIQPTYDLLRSADNDADAIRMQVISGPLAAVIDTCQC